ncbi:MAG: hypothetical protein KC636_17855, partial [Myxococcales bacterium]|nr:hypothetical protein [Myxococcales bacterium]
MGGYESEDPCNDECVDGLGCTLCIPGEGTCNGDALEVCNDQGDGYDQYECDPVQGLSCNDDLNACEGACSPQSLGLNYIGCDYYPTVLLQHDNYNQNQHQFAVSVSNTTNQSANITVTRGNQNVANDTVPANSVKVIVLPWVNEMTKGNQPSKVV